MVDATQLSVWPQPWLAHDVPATGGAAHVRKTEPDGIAQNPDWHCAEYEHVAPFALGPSGVTHWLGGDTPDKYAPQVSAVSSDAQAFSCVGLFAVLGAASACVHAS